MGTRILIVDDHPEFRAMARLMLGSHGFEVVGEAVDGATALEAAQRLQPDLVLLDVGLPDCDGFEVARALHAAGGPPVVLTSAFAAGDYGALIGASPARGFLTKSRLSGTALRELLAG